VGAGLVPGLVCYRAKVLREDILMAGPVPYSIVRATRFFEFIPAVLSWAADESTVRRSAALVQPVAPADIARPVAGVVVRAPACPGWQREGARGSTTVPAAQLGRVEHDPKDGDLGLGRTDADHRDGSASPAQR
jgi:hypothetical protein